MQLQELVPSIILQLWPRLSRSRLQLLPGQQSAVDRDFLGRFRSLSEQK